MLRNQMVLIADAKEVGVENPAEETFRNQNQLERSPGTGEVKPVFAPISPAAARPRRNALVMAGLVFCAGRLIPSDHWPSIAHRQIVR